MLAERARRNLLSLEGPEHVRLRRLVTKAFTPRAVERQRSHVRRVVNGLLDPFCEKGQGEFVAEVTEPFPVMVICEVLGTPVKDWKLFSDWVEILFSRLGLDLDDAGVRLVLRTQDDLDAYLLELIDRRRRTRDEDRGDLLGELMAVEEEGDRLTSGELITLVQNILSAGVDTTRNELASAVALVTDHPNQLRRLVDDPSLIERAVEEVLRFRPVVPGTLRVAAENVDLNGVTFPEGTVVVPTMMAANRDPAVYTEPDRFDVGREQVQPHLSLGGGAHYCLGAALARVELTEGIAAVARRMPDLRLDGHLRWKSPVGITGPEALPVAFTPGH